MIHNHLRQFIAAGMITICSTTFFHGNLVSAAEKSEPFQPVDFSEMKYEHLNTQKFYDTVKEIKQLLKEEGNSKKIVKKWNSLVNYLNQFNNENIMVQLYNSLDVTNSNYVKESQYCTAEGLNLEDALVNVTQDILATIYKDDLKKSIGDDESLKKLLNQKPLTKRQHELLNEEKNLVLKYNELSTITYSTIIDGTSYTEDELSYNSNLPEETVTKAMRRIYEKKNRTLGNIYVKLVKIRKELAESLNYDSYADYCYKELYNRDFTPDDAAVFCEEVKQEIAPYCEKLQEQITSSVDFYALSEKYGSMSAEEKCKKIEPYLSEISPSLVTAYDFMKEYHLFDIDYKDKKANGGFTLLLPKYDEPYICIQPDCIFYDLSTFIHEFGHFHSSIVNRDEHGRYNNLDLAEIHSQGLELIYTKYYNKLFEKEDAAGLLEFTVFNILESVRSGCLYDEFQREVFEMDDPTLNKINQLFTDLAYEYHMIPQTSELATGWVDIGHSFDVPFYYISYATAAAPALEIWQKSLTDYNSACKTYTNIVNHGERSEYQKTLAECNLSNPFTKGYCKQLAETINAYLIK